MIYFSDFGSSKGVDLDVLFYLSVFDILEIFMGKINFFWQKKILEITRMTIILPKSPKYP